MPARKRRITLSDDWKERIKVGEMLSRLQMHFNGEVELSQTQIAAAKLLLSKVMPDLKSVDQFVDVNVTHSVINAQPEMTTEEWIKSQQLSGSLSLDRKQH